MAPSDDEGSLTKSMVEAGASPTREAPTEEHSPDSADEPDTDKFEDAVDPSSPRSLMQRLRSSTSSQETRENKDTQAHVPEHTLVAENMNIEEGPTLDGVESAMTGEDAGKASSRDEERSSQDMKRLSQTSDLEPVSLDDDVAAKTAMSSVSGELKSAPHETAAPVQTQRTLSLSSVANALPSLPWSPPSGSPSKSPEPSIVSVTSPPTTMPQPTAPSRKLTSPFSWLSRTATGKDKESQASPPATAARRNTASSVTTLTSNPEMMLSKLDEEQEGQSSNGISSTTRSSLKDRFKLLRMREEAGIPTHAMDDKSNSAIATLARSNTAALGLSDSVGTSGQPPTSPVPSPNETLAPGTVSGVNAGPSALTEEQVDWDLWQSVVYEGPAAVARTSHVELNRAITTGIPSAIRGVIWQVLANSYNDGLEEVYHHLLQEGSRSGKDRNSNSTTASQTSIGQQPPTGDDAASASSSSSVHSRHSDTQSTANSSKGDKSAEPSAKAQAATSAQRKQQDKDKAAQLQKLEKTIRRDMGARTSFSKYAAAAGLQEGLFGVCKAYALYDEGVGYAQGMNFLIMPLLFNMPEQEAFCLLVRLMNQYNLRDLFIQDMPGLHLRLYQFERLLEDLEPALYCHLHRRGISPHLYATQWFLTLFAYRFPLQLVLRIYDLILSEGLSAILRFGIVLMQRNAPALLQISDMQQLTAFLKDKLFDVYVDKDPSQGSLLESGFFGSSSSSIEKEVYRADQLVRDACEVKLTPETLKMYTSEWEEKVKAEKEREVEMLTLRMANQDYMVRLRKLEERVEACDREQASLATEHVHTKVENQELKDENEGLKGQVDELRLVIEKQPLEIEEAWKLERDDLMKRNEKVHEENQRLEKELGELEEELVQTKMRYAEINSQHETLNRKWSDLKRQFA